LTAILIPCFSYSNYFLLLLMPNSPISPAEISRNIAGLGIDTIAVFSCVTGLTLSIPRVLASLPPLFIKAVAIHKVVATQIISISTTFFLSFAIKLFLLFIKGNCANRKILNSSYYKNYAI